MFLSFLRCSLLFFFFFNDTATTEIYTLSLHDALPIAGDGGFMYQVGELATAVRHNLAVVVVVFDNGGFGNVKRIQQQHYGNRLIASDLQNPDFGKLAESFGIATFKALDAAQLEACLKKAFALNAPALVWVPHGDVPSPWDMILMPRARGASGI